MAKYKVLQKTFQDRIYNPGELIDLEGPVNPEIFAPAGGSGHQFEDRRYDVQGGAGLTLEKRAEISSTRKPWDPPK